MGFGAQVLEVSEVGPLLRVVGGGGQGFLNVLASGFERRGFQGLGLTYHEARLGLGIPLSLLGFRVGGLVLLRCFGRFRQYNCIGLMEFLTRVLKLFTWFRFRGQAQEEGDAQHSQGRGHAGGAGTDGRLRSTPWRVRVAGLGFTQLLGRVWVQRGFT